MKRFITTIFSIFFIISSLSGCAQTNTPAASSGKISIVSTIFAPYDFSREVAGDNADISMLLHPGSESHSYEPTPQDIIKIQNCDVFVYVGGESDTWVHDVLNSMDTSKMKIVTLMDCVDVVEEELVEGMEGDREDEDDHSGEDGHGEAELDEHVWTSTKNAKLIIQKLSDALCEVDGSNADAYKQNTEAYIAELNDLEASFDEVIASAARKTIVFGDRFPFRYLADAYGLDYFAAFPGCSTDTEASVATVAFLIDKVKAENIPVIFHVELSNQKMADTISEATGAKVRLLHACHNITKTDFDNGLTYIDLMKQNLVNLKEALE